MIGLTRPLVLLFAALAIAASIARAEELLPPDRPIDEVADHYLEEKLKGAAITPAPETDDAGLVRRLTLDLIGRIPTAAEVRGYVESRASDKRVALVDRLIGSPAFVRHQVNEFDAMMMAGTRGSLRDYLTKALGENRPWDQMFRELVLADESDPARTGAAAFLKPRVKDLDRLTNDVSTTFFGVNVSCAKCHDHPRVHDWKQDHYYGMKSFFGRTYASGEFLGERDTGVIKFQTTKGLERQAKPMFLTGKIVDAPEAQEPSKEEQRKQRRQAEESRKKKQPPPPPKFSIRAQLVDVALQPKERDFFTRAIVNRLWNRFYGNGLVMPLDQMHSENPPSHPELLAWLARDLVEHHYDLRRLVRGLVSTRAYARSSRWAEGDAPESSLFALAALRPLTPMQLAASMWVATTDPAALAGDRDAKAVQQTLDGEESKARGLAELLARPGEDYQIGVSEALLLSNGDRIKELLAEGNERLVGRLAQIKDRDERIDIAVRNVLSRPPDDDEVSLLSEFLSGRDDRPLEGCRQLVWALLTSAEFRFNY